MLLMNMIIYARIDTNNSPGYLWNTMPSRIYWATDGNYCNSTTGKCELKVSNNEISGEHSNSGYTYSYATWQSYYLSKAQI